MQNIPVKFEKFEEKLNCCKPGERLESTVFRTYGHSWSVHVYPLGLHCEDQSGKAAAVSVFLKLVGIEKVPDNKRPTVDFFLAIGIKGTQQLTSQQTSHKFNPVDDDWGYEEFIRVSELRANREVYMPNGDLQVFVKFTRVTKGHASSAPQPQAGQVAAPARAARNHGGKYSGGKHEVEARAALAAAQGARERAARILALHNAKVEEARARVALAQALQRVKAGRAALEASPAARAERGTPARSPEDGAPAPAEAPAADDEDRGSLAVYSVHRRTS